MEKGVEDYGVYWSGVVDSSRTPSPAPTPTKGKRQSFGRSTSPAALARKDLDFTTFDARSVDRIWLEAGNDACELGLADSTPPSISGPNEQRDLTSGVLPATNSTETIEPSIQMRTGCIPCLAKGKPCDPRDPSCKVALSDDWNLNYPENGDDEHGTFEHPTPESMSLSAYRPDTKWRRSWRERHSLNFFVNFSAPQMAGFFDSTFWQRMVIQASYQQPAILHAITAIGALHEAILQKAFTDEKRKAQAMEFALSQCNRAIASLTTSRGRGRDIVDSRVALTTCVLFTCFEAMQGRCDSAVIHALQGRKLLQAITGPNGTTMTPQEEGDLERMRPLVERLEVQATALLDKGKRPDMVSSEQNTPLPLIEQVFNLDHAHNVLHLAMNSVMRFMQNFQPTAPSEEIAATMAEKYLRYAPWFQQWEVAFTAYLADNRGRMSNMDVKRAMVLKANHLVGSMLAAVDQSEGPGAYDAYEAEFKAIIDLSREVLASFSCPPLPTLSDGTSRTPYLSFSLWVTDALWMAISRCRDPSIRQAAFTLLSQNPRQEGIWHAGPSLANHRFMRRVEAGPSHLKDTVKGDNPSEQPRPQQLASFTDENYEREDDDGNDSDNDLPMTARETEPVGNVKVRAEWVDLTENK